MTASSRALSLHYFCSLPLNIFLNTLLSGKSSFAPCVHPFPFHIYIFFPVCSVC